MVSIIVPVYNVEKYLEKCVDSLIKQTYQELEIILIDDESTDSSGRICEELAKKDTRIKVIHKTNEGLGYARNTGLNNATGDYVVFVDSDDYLETNSIQNMYEKLKKDKANVCIGGFKRITDDGRILYEEKYKNKKYEGKEEINRFLSQMIGSAPNKKDSIRMSVWNCLYDLRIINKNNIRFLSEREYLSEDIFFNLEYYRYVNKVLILNDSDYYYRVNEKSLTKSYREDRFEATKKLYKKELEIIKSINLYEEAKYRLMRQFFIYVLACIKQENSKISNKTLIQSVKNIRNICKDELVQGIIKEYPVKCLNIKQRTFVELMKYKKALLLYFISNINWR